MSTLSDRLHKIVQKTTNEYRRFKELEIATGVPGDTWKSWFHGRQRPTADMIEAACKTWPEYAFWLTTGIDDFEHGHTRVFNDSSMNGRERTAARALFMKEIEFQAWLKGHGNPEVSTPEDAIETEYLSEIWRLSQLRDGQAATIAKLEEATGLQSYLEAKKSGAEF